MLTTCLSAMTIVPVKALALRQREMGMPKDVVDFGLNQMDAGGLRRVIRHVNAGKPMCLNGQVFGSNGEG
jgi:hypothetical protein